MARLILDFFGSIRIFKGENNSDIKVLDVYINLYMQNIYINTNFLKWTFKYDYETLDKDM